MELPFTIIGLAVLADFGLVFAIILFNFFGIWLRARIANAPVGMGKMIGKRLRRGPVGLIVDKRINKGIRLWKINPTKNRASRIPSSLTIRTCSFTKEARDIVTR